MSYEIKYHLPAEEYHSRPEISLHQLLEYSKSPAHGEYKRLNPITPTPAMKFGSAFHSYVLDGTVSFFSQYAIKPKVDGRTTEGKSALRKFYSENEGKVDITEDDFRTIKEMTMTLDGELRHGRIIDFDKGDNEVSLILENEGVEVRSRIDSIQNGFLADLKTTDSAHPDDFTKSIINFRYYVQAAFYLDNAAICGIKADDFYFVAIEKTPPYGIKTVRLGLAFLEAGRRYYKNLLRVYRECRAINHFPSYSTDIITIQPPQYLVNSIQ